jgi:hypothetical protein
MRPEVVRSRNAFKNACFRVGHIVWNETQHDSYLEAWLRGYANDVANPYTRKLLLFFLDKKRHEE